MHNVEVSSPEIGSQDDLYLAPPGNEPTIVHIVRMSEIFLRTSKGSLRIS